MFEAEENFKGKEKYEISEALASLSSASPTSNSPAVDHKMSRPGGPRRLGSFVFRDDEANVTNTSAIWGDTAPSPIATSASTFSSLRTSTLSPPPSSLTANHRPANPEI